MSERDYRTQTTRTEPAAEPPRIPAQRGPSDDLPEHVPDGWYAQEREHAATMVRSGRVLAAALLFWLASATLAVWLLSR